MRSSNNTAKRHKPAFSSTSISYGIPSAPFSLKAQKYLMRLRICKTIYSGHDLSPTRTRLSPPLPNLVSSWFRIHVKKNSSEHLEGLEMGWGSQKIILFAMAVAAARSERRGKNGRDKCIESPSDATLQHVSPAVAPIALDCNSGRWSSSAELMRSRTGVAIPCHFKWMLLFHTSTEVWI